MCGDHVRRPGPEDAKLDRILRLERELVRGKARAEARELRNRKGAGELGRGAGNSNTPSRFSRLVTGIMQLWVRPLLVCFSAVNTAIAPLPWRVFLVAGIVHTGNRKTPYHSTSWCASAVAGEVTA